VAKGAVPWDTKMADDRSALHLHLQPVVQILHDDDDHRLLDILIDEDVLQVGLSSEDVESSSMNSSLVLNDDLIYKSTRIKHGI
jgi:hypothetical protein